MTSVRGMSTNSNAVCSFKAARILSSASELGDKLTEARRPADAACPAGLVWPARLPRPAGLALPAGLA